MKIEKQILLDFLKKVGMQGTNSIEEAIFNFTETGLKVSATTEGKTARVDALLKSSAFKEYEAIEEIGIQDISTIRKIVGTFSDNLTFQIEGNIITFKDKAKEMTTELLDTQFIDKVAELKEMEHDEIITLESSTLKEIIADANINKEFSLKLTTKEKSVSIVNTGKYAFKRYLTIPEAKGGVEVYLGEPFVDAVSNLTGSLKVHLKTNYPIKIYEKTDDMIVTMIVAPQTTEE